MRFWLSFLGFIYAIDNSKTPTLTLSSVDPTVGTSAIVPPEKKDYNCYHHILSYLSDKLYGLYFEHNDTKEL